MKTFKQITIILIFLFFLVPQVFGAYQLGTVQTGKMPSAEVGMTFFVDLAELIKAGNDVFDTCRSDGGDIRIYSEDGLTQYPRHIIRINTVTETGWLTLKGDLDVGEKVRVDYNGIRTEPAADSTYGSENAWDATYDAALTTPDFGNDRILDATANDNHMAAVNSQIAHVFTSVSGTGPTAHQFATYDGSDYYFGDTNFLYKRSTITGSNTATNSDPSGDLNTDKTATTDHVGAGEAYGSYIYIPIQRWTSCVDEDQPFIVRFNKSDLTYVDAYDISAQSHGTSALTIDENAGTNGIIYITDFCDGSKIYKYDLITPSTYLGSITVSPALADDGPQGICLDPTGDGFIISRSQTAGGNENLFRIELDGTNIGRATSYNDSKPITAESIFTYDNKLFWWDGYQSGGGFKLYEYDLLTNIDGPTGTPSYIGDGSDDTLGLGYGSLTYTLPDTGSVQFIIQPREYFNFNSIFDNSVEQNDWEGWNQLTGPFFAARVDVTLSFDPDNLHSPNGEDFDYYCYLAWTKNGANVNQALIIDGAIRDSDSSTWIAPGTTFYINGGNAGNQIGSNYYWFVALRNIDISQDSDRLTSEYNNQSDQAGFWSWGDEVQESSTGVETINIGNPGGINIGTKIKTGGIQIQ